LFFFHIFPPNAFFAASISADFFVLPSPTAKAFPSHFTSTTNILS